MTNKTSSTIPVSSPISTEELSFFETLQKRILRTGKVHSRVYGAGTTFDWIDRITEEELKRIEELITNRSNVYIVPINIDMGFSVGFRIHTVSHKIYPIMKVNNPRIFIISQQAFPETYEAKNFFPICKLPKNLTLLKEAEPNERVRDYESYEY